MADPVAFDAVILAGGRGSRLGGVSKADLVVGGRRLLDRVLDAASGAESIVVVGRVEVPAGVIRTLEDPPGTGPAAGLAAGLRAIDRSAPWTLVLACDLPGAADGTRALLSAAGPLGPASDPATSLDSPPDPADPGVGAPAALCLRGRDGGPEWLFGLYRSAPLRQAVAAYGDPADRSVRRMLAPLEPHLVDPGDAAGDDLDTWADHARWNAELRRRKSMPQSEDRSAWRPFIEQACAALGIDAAGVDEDLVLDMTREVAHSGARPMAPVSAYILGLAVGRGGDAEHLRRVLEDAVSAAPIPEGEDAR